MVYIEIDGQQVEVPQGATIIEIADKLNIPIPRFCYHKKLSIAANCRMCLVEVEKAPKPLPACATPVTDGMKVWTRSPKTIMAQKAVMEFLLINHPLDCPICDQGGECELQDVAMGYGSDVSQFVEGKRSVKDKDIGPLIATEMTRCIHCTRCIRFGAEIAGVRELGATGRGEWTEIGTYIEQAVDNELSGNVIDLCPVGALTSKPYRFRARSWEMTQHNSISPHDCWGSNLSIHQRRGEVLRVVPKENENINEAWISDRDRFSYEALDSKDRLRHPMIKKDGQWIAVSWLEALETIANQLEKQLGKHGPSSIGGLFSPSATTEEFYIGQKFLRGLGSNNIDHRLRQIDFRGQAMAPSYPNLGVPIAELENQEMVLLVGSWIHKELPLAGAKLRKLVSHGGKVAVINPCQFAFNFEVEHHVIAAHQADLCAPLAGIAVAMLEHVGKKAPKGAEILLKDVKPTEQEVAIANALRSVEKRMILLGHLALYHPDYSRIVVLSHLITQLMDGSFGQLTEGANSAGAWLAGCLPHLSVGGHVPSEPGLNAQEMLEHSLKVYFLHNFEPDLDTANGFRAMQSLKKAEYVIALTTFKSDALAAVANVLLPIASFTENTGTLVNVEGRWQTIEAVHTPIGEARPAWKVYRVFGNLCNLAGFDFNTIEDVRSELKDKLGLEPMMDGWQWWCPNESESKPQRHEGWTRLGKVPLYQVDGLVRRATSLQKTKDAGKPSAYVSAYAAQKKGLKEGDIVTLRHHQQSIQVPLKINEGIPDDCVFIDAAHELTMALGELYEPIELERG